LSRFALLIAFSAAAALTASTALAAQPVFDRAAWMEDYAYLKHQAEALYANLAWMGSPQSGVDVPELDRRTLKDLSDATTDEEARRAIHEFVLSFHDGHFSELGDVQARPAGAAKPVEPPKPELKPGDAATGCAALGYASTARVVFSAPFESLKGFQLEADGLSSVFRAGTIDDGAGGRLGVVRIQNFRATPFPAACMIAWQTLAKTGKPIDEDGLEDAAKDAWFKALADQLKRFKAEGVRAVIVDIGANSGGDDSGDYAVRLFTDRPVRSTPVWMAAAPPAVAYFDGETDDLKRGLAHNPTEAGRQALEAAMAAMQAGKARLAAVHCDLSWTWHERRPWRLDGCNRLVAIGTAGGPSEALPAGAFGNPDTASRLSGASSVDAYWGAWTGKVYVLTSATSYSSAEMFAAEMQDNGVARTIGVKTGGDGCGFMTDSEPVVLPHSRMRFRMPNCVRVRRDGSDEVAGIRPDLPITPLEGESERGRAQHIVTTIVRDLAH
jgi:hypothetical protein